MIKEKALIYLLDNGQYEITRIQSSNESDHVIGTIDFNPERARVAIVKDIGVTEILVLERILLQYLGSYDYC